MDAESVKSLSDDDLFKLLDTVSGEVKRRNGLIGPSIADVRSRSAEENVRSVVEALASLGAHIKQAAPEPQRGPPSDP